MGDGSSNILNQDSLKDFDGKYGFGKTDHKFPADAFVLKPPYSANGNVMNFVEKALNMMNKGYAAIIIQNTAGSGKAKEYNKRILQKHTLIASIKMPIDLFIGKSSVQTNIYVFKVNERHHKDEMVKFIDFSNDGYTRTNRKKASNNLKDTGRAKERYEELIDLVRFGKSKLKIFSEKEYFENRIDPLNGSDWNQSAPIDTKPTLQDFKKTVGNYLAWEVSNILKKQNDDEKTAKSKLTHKEKIQNIEWSEYKLEDLFDIFSSKKIYHANKIREIFDNQVLNSFPYIVRSTQNNGLKGYIIEDEKYTNDANTLSFAQDTFSVFYQKQKYFTGNKVKVLKAKFENKNEKVMPYLTACFQKSLADSSWGTGSTIKTIAETKIQLPTKNDKIDFEFMEQFIAELEAEHIAELEAYLLATGLKKFSK